MVTHYIIENNIPQNQENIILNMFKSWDIDVKVEKRDKSFDAGSNFPFSAGMWEDYEIDDKTLRAKAWGTNKINLQ